MPQSTPLVITISRQLGCGAGQIGQQLAARLGMLYLDRELLQHAAEELSVSEDALEHQDETVPTFWQSLVASFAYGSPEAVYAPPLLNQPNGHELFATQSRIIARVAQTQSAVIVGRGGSHVLRDHPRHVGVFLHADMAFRIKRVSEAYHLSEQEARSAVEESDSSRARYRRAVANRDWDDARQYHLCLDTGDLDLDAATDIIVAYVERRFGVTATEQPPG